MLFASTANILTFRDTRYDWSPGANGIVQIKPSKFQRLHPMVIGTLDIEIGSRATDEGLIHETIV